MADTQKSHSITHQIFRDFSGRYDSMYKITVPGDLYGNH